MLRFGRLAAVDELADGRLGGPAAAQPAREHFGADQLVAHLAAVRGRVVGEQAANDHRSAIERRQIRASPILLEEKEHLFKMTSSW